MALTFRLSASRSFFIQGARLSSSSSADQPVTHEEEEFRVLNLRPHSKVAVTRKQFRKMPSLPPRSRQMPPDQDWGNVWPGPKTFHPASVPLPLRQGFTEGGKAPPGKFANAELMKIPNFLHLTPPVIKRQCEAIKKFCSPWPKGLENEDNMEKLFPLKVITTDYCLSSPTIRNTLARVVALKIKLSALNFDEHAKDKFFRLVKERYNEETDELTIVTDRCPLRKQNFDYAMYLLTAVCHESRVVEPWEKEKTLDDMEYYDWKLNKSKINSEAILNWGKTEKDQKISAPSKYATAVERLINEGENKQNLLEYKECVLELLGLKKATPELKVQDGDT
uniref:CSON011733 protein n=1 Tax=Culicoides sonorensis TaxID=179676 RepID=A0A336M7S7_CULSO